MMFFDAFSFAFPAALQRIPYSLFVSLIWTVVTYFPVGLAGEPSRYSSSSSCFCYGMHRVWLHDLVQTQEWSSPAVDPHVKSIRQLHSTGLSFLHECPYCLLTVTS